MYVYVYEYMYVRIFVCSYLHLSLCCCPLGGDGSEVMDIVCSEIAELAM